MKIKHILFVLLILSLCACSLDSSTETGRIDADQSKESTPPSAMISSSDAATEPALATLPPPLEGKQINERDIEKQRQKTIIISCIKSDGSFGKYYEFPIYVNETDCNNAGEFTYSDRTISLSMYTTENPSLSLSTRNLNSADVFSYVYSNTAERSYIALENDEAKQHVPDIEVTIREKDGFLERYGIVSSGHILRSFGDAGTDYSTYTEISETAVPEIVVMHLASIVFQYAEIEINDQSIATLLQNSYPPVTAVEVVLHDKSVTLTEIALKDFISLLGDKGQTSAVLSFREESTDKDDIRFVPLIDSNRKEDPLTAKRSFRIAPDGTCCFEQRNGVSISAFNRTYYMYGLSMLITYPLHVDYDAVISLLE